MKVGERLVGRLENELKRERVRERETRECTDDEQTETSLCLLLDCNCPSGPLLDGILEFNKWNSICFKVILGPVLEHRA